MAEQKSLREQWVEAQQKRDLVKQAEEAAKRAPLLAAADKYLNGLADRLAGELEKAIEKENPSPELYYSDNGSPGGGNNSLNKVSADEIRQMSGYARVRAVGADPRIDMDIAVQKEDGAQYIVVSMGKSFQETEEEILKSAATIKYSRGGGGALSGGPT